MNEDAQRRINEAVAKAKNSMLDATRIANEQLCHVIWKKLDSMTGKIETLQGTLWGKK